MRLFLISCALFIALNTRAEQPNIIIILADDAGSADFSCYGSKQVKTPYIDAMAKAGMKFTQAYAAASVCSPSRAGLLTGRYQQTFGHLSNIPHKQYPFNDSEKLGLPVSEITLANALKNLGYSTHCIGKWHLGEADHFHPNSRGFDNFYGFLSGARTYHLGVELSGDQDKIMRNWNIAEPTSGYTTEVFTDEAIRIIKEKNQQPFFIYLSHNAVHGPMDARDQDIMDYPFKDPKRKKFSGLLKSFDDQTGRLMNALKKNNQYENTLIFFMSDNGGPSDHNGSSNWPLRGKKGSEFEGGNRSPFIVQWPEKIPASLESNIPVIAYDIFATSIAAAGGNLAPDREYHGQDIMKILDQSYNAQRPLFWSRGTNFAIREGKWKLLITENENSLFNLEEDQTEKYDLSVKYPEVKEALNKKLLVWKASHTQALWSSGYKTKKHKKAVK